MNLNVYDLMWFTYAAMLVILLWPRASRDVSAVLLLHGKALGLLYRRVRQGVGDYLGQMGLRRYGEMDVTEHAKPSGIGVLHAETDDVMVWLGERPDRCCYQYNVATSTCVVHSKRIPYKRGDKYSDVAARFAAYDLAGK